MPVTAISLADSPDGSTNDDVHVYRTAGPGSDPEVGLPPDPDHTVLGRGLVLFLAEQEGQPIAGTPSRYGSTRNGPCPCSSCW